jgi:hypothetical protein
MIQIITKKRSITITALFAFMISFAQTNVWTGAQSTKWNTAANWSANAIPVLTTDVEIPYVASGNYPVIDGQDGTADCRNINLNFNVLVTVADYGTLRISGATSGSGKVDAINGTVVYIGNAPQTLNASMFKDNTVKNYTNYNSWGVTLAGSLNITGMLSLQTGVFATNNGLTIKSTSTNTALVAEAASGTITGNVTVERYIPARRAFRLLSSPTTGGTIQSNWQEAQTDVTGFGTAITGQGGTANGFDATATNNPSLYTHNNANATWVAATNTKNTALNAGDPYRILVRGDRTVNLASNTSVPTATILRSVGTLTTGTVSVNNLNQAAGGFSFVGNPYQSVLNMQQVLEDAGTFNVNNNFYYVWDPTVGIRGAYVTVNIGTNSNTNPSSVASKYLQPNQAFFVQTIANASAGVMFKESHKYTVGTTMPNLYRTTDANESMIALALYADDNLANGPAADGFVARFSDSYTNDVDGFDAVKPINQDENVGLINNGITLSFESRALPTVGEVMALTNTAYRGTSYTYKITTGEFQNVTAYLNDAFLGTSTPLENNAETLYSFTVIPGEAGSTADNRFAIEFKSTTLSLDTAVSQNAVLYPNPSTGGTFNIQLPVDAEQATVNIYNQLGQRVAGNVSAQGGNLTVQPQAQLMAGIYMVEVNTGNKVYTQKLIVKN